MNDHNLDDLIIDNIDPKNSKTKNFLTIIALAIVVLIVAIILTKIILKNPNDQFILEENNSQLISSDLTLEEEKTNISNVEHIKDELALNPDKKPASTTAKPKTTQNADKRSQQARMLAKKEQREKVQAARELKARRIAKEKEAKEKARMHEKDMAKEKETKPKLPTNVNGIPSPKGYYIQVGSFSKTPSSRFLSIIKNSGFDYQITEISDTGNKKLLIGPYKERSEALTALVRVKDRINKSAFVIKK